MGDGNGVGAREHCQDVGSVKHPLVDSFLVSVDNYPKTAVKLFGVLVSDLIRQVVPPDQRQEQKSLDRRVTGEQMKNLGFRNILVHDNYSGLRVADRVPATRLDGDGNPAEALLWHRHGTGRRLGGTGDVCCGNPGLLPAADHLGKLGLAGAGAGAARPDAAVVECDGS